MATKKETATKETKAKAKKEEVVANEETTTKKTTKAKKDEAQKEVETKTEEKTNNTESKPVEKRTYYKPYNKNFGGKRRKKFCKFCAKGIEHVDYKDVETLRKYLNHHLKIMSARLTGTCSKHQKRVSNAIKRARIVALIPFIIQD